MNMLKILLSCALVLCAFARGGAQNVEPKEMKPTHHLMPVPAVLKFQTGRFALDRSFTVIAQGYVDERLKSAIARAIGRLAARTGFELAANIPADVNAASLVIRCQAAGKSIPSLDEDESYALEVKEKQIVLNAPTVVGALRGLETFLQLVEADRDGYFLPFVEIEDQPRFRWRGLLIDVCRHWMPVETIRRELDGMAALKLNVLHLHLTEDQGFRIESKKYPKLHQMGSDGLFYTQEEMRALINYARERGIRIVPEFDMPGHTTAWFVGHPELASAPGAYRIERRWGIFDPAMNPTREETYKFLDAFLGEMARLFPDEYMHIGGDEVNGRQWKNNPQIQAFMQAHNLKDKHALQAYFNQRLLKILDKHGKKMIGWDEILHPDLPQNIVVQSWRGQKSLAEAARQGYNGILSSGYYLDYNQSAELHYSVDPLPAEMNLSDREASHVLGGEACMWSEYVSPENIDTRIWTRLPAIAERLWSPREVKDVEDMYRRLARVERQLEDLSLKIETAHAAMLRRLANGETLAPLKTLADAVEPAKVYKRGELRPNPTQMSPLTYLIDAAYPESIAAREMRLMTDALLSDAPRFQTHRADLERAFKQWRDAQPELDLLIERSPILHETAPLAKELAEMGAAGLEAIAYLSKNAAPPKQWREARLALVEAASKPNSAAVQFAYLPAFKQLIIGATEVEQLKTMSPSDWKRRVAQLAEPKRNN
jgi:hexosaminidase